MSVNTESQILNVPIEDIIPNRFQPRLNFDDAALSELAASIKEHGIIQPLVLRRLGDKYEIIAGERRYKASKMAGLTSVPAIISNISDEKSAEVAIVENVQRKNLTSIEEAKSYKALLDKGYLTQEDLAKKMGLSQSAISNKLRLLTLSDEAQKALMEGKISERHARSLLQILDKNEQVKWLNKVIEERLTVRELERKIKEEVAASELDKKILEKFNSQGETKTQEGDTINIGNNINNIEVDKPMPNKFFNFLEDEVVNMSVEEEKETKEEEIELLDFAVPTVEKEEVKETLDITKADNLFESLLTELESNNYKGKLEKIETNRQIKYVVTIDKE